MEEEPIRKLSQLFCPVKDKPMQFAIIIKNVLNMECERVIRHIEEKGGEFMGFDPEDSEHIVLASSKYKPPPHQTVFDIKYVKRCVKEKKILDLRDFQLSGEKISGPRCCSFQGLVEANRCRHFQTAEEVLNILKFRKIPKRTLKKTQEKNIPKKLDTALAHLEIMRELARRAEN